MVDNSQVNTPTDALDQVQATYSALVEGETLTRRRAEQYLAGGLDRDVLHTISDLANHAIRVNSAYPRYVHRLRGGRRPLVDATTRELIRDTDQISRGFTRHHRSKHNPALGPPGPAGFQAMPQVLAWAEVLALTPDPKILSRLHGTIDVQAPRWTQMFGDLGPLVTAAGLSRAEAEQQQADGALDPASLLTLAALRGYDLLSHYQVDRWPEAPAGGDCQPDVTAAPEQVG